MDLGLQGARAIVTGGSSGLGLAIARGLVAEGARVAIAARNATKLDEAANGMRAASSECELLTMQTNTTDDRSVQTMVQSVEEVWGGVDILVNAAAQPSLDSGNRPLAELNDSDVMSDFDTKVLGYLRCARAVAPQMQEQGWGRIVNISGLNTRRTGSVSGSIRNAAVAAMTANLADELGPYGVGVTVVHPGLVQTERTPAMLSARSVATGRPEEEVLEALESSTSLGRIVTATEVADVVVFLCSRRAAAITGDPVTVAGGNRGSIHY